MTCESLAVRRGKWLERLPIEKTSPRFLLDLLHRIRKITDRLVELSKYVPHKRHDICMMLERLVWMALEVEELREKVKV